MANLKDVAKLAGVSVMTASRVINRNGYVKAATREKVEEAIRSLNYYPNNLGRGLNKNQVHIIAALAPIVGGPIENDPYYTRLLYGIEEVLLEESYDLLLCTQRRRQVGGVSQFDYFRPYMERKADALILMGAVLSDRDKAFIDEHSIPFCIIGDRPDMAGINVVDSRNREGIGRMLDEAYRLGHRDIAFCGRDIENFNILERFTGYREFLEEKGLPLREEWVIDCINRRDSGRSIIHRFMELDKKPTMLLCSTDHFAVDAMLEARDQGIRIPEDVSISGFDGIPLGQMMVPRLSSMHQPLEAMGRKAADLVLKSLRNPGDTGESCFFDVEYLEGQSIRAL